MSKRVIVIGELNIDMILNNIAGFPEIGTEKIADKLDITLGSSSAIFAANLASFGTEVSYIGMVGNDSFGSFIIDSLKGKKVDTSNVIKSKSLKTGVTVVLNYDMDRAMVTYPGAMEELCFDHIEEDLIAKYDHVHISSVFLQPGIKNDLVKIFKLCKDKGLTTSLDPQWDPEEKWDLHLNDLLPHVDVFLPNSKEFCAITGSESIQEGIDKYQEFGSKMIIKDGENGSHAFLNNKLVTKPAFLNEVIVDCIGAGDSFDAGFIHKFINDGDTQESMEFGNIAGAINTTSYGGTHAFSDKEKIVQIAKDKFSYKINI